MKVHEMFGQKVPVIPKPSAEWPIPDCRVGLEFEFEDPHGSLWAVWFDRAGLDKYWRTVGDGSLRDNGVEIILREPLMGEQLSEAIRQMTTTNCPLVQTYRTSIHVHIDARDMDVEQLKTAALLYAMVEAGMFAYVGQNRDSSNYSVPWYASTRYLRTVADALFANRANSAIRDRISGTQRYSALNIQALRKYGSLEFRHMGQTMDHDKITKWVKGCMSIKSAAMEHAYEEVEPWIYHDPHTVYNHVFGPLAGAFLRDTTTEMHETSFATAGMLVSFIASEAAAKMIGSKFGKGQNPVYEQAVNRLKERP